MRRRFMKALVKETDQESLLALMGKKITFYCVNYIYSGKLVGVNTDVVKLDDAMIVYETGAHSDKSWSSSESFPNPVYIRLSAIEMFTEWKQ
jgi:hypothetical protein